MTVPATDSRDAEVTSYRVLHSRPFVCPPTLAVKQRSDLNERVWKVSES